MKTYFYLYQITNLVNSKIYVGVHKTKNLDDGYFGSGKVIRRAIEKYGIENFKKEILEQFGTSEEMFAREKEVVNEEFLEREDVYNLRRGGHGGFDHINKEGLSVRNITRFNAAELAKKSNNTKKILFQTDKEWAMNYKMNLSKALSGRPGTFLGKTHTKETKEKIGAKTSIAQRGEGNSQFGKMWITDGTESKKIMKTDQIPEGWRKGRKI